MQYSKQKCNIPFWIRVYNFPFGQCSVFLQGQYPYNIWSIPWKVTPCPLKECSVHFHMSKLPFKGAVALLEKSISFCTIYIYIYVYIYIRIYIYAVLLTCWTSLSRVHNLFVFVIVSPLGQIRSASMVRDKSHLKIEMFSISNNNVVFI